MAVSCSICGEKKSWSRTVLQCPNCGKVFCHKCVGRKCPACKQKMVRA